MSTAIIIILLILICIFSVKSYMKKLAHGCCSTGGDEEKVSETKADLWEYKYKYTVKICGMSCKKCAARIENAFNRKDGLYANVDFKSEVAEIYSNTDVQEFTIRQTVIGLGYSVEKIKENELYINSKPTLHKNERHS